MGYEFLRPTSFLASKSVFVAFQCGCEKVLLNLWDNGTKNPYILNSKIAREGFVFLVFEIKVLSFFRPAHPMSKKLGIKKRDKWRTDAKNFVKSFH